MESAGARDTKVATKHLGTRLAPSKWGRFLAAVSTSRACPDAERKDVFKDLIAELLVRGRHHVQLHQTRLVQLKITSCAEDQHHSSPRYRSKCHKYVGDGSCRSHRNQSSPLPQQQATGTPQRLHRQCLPLPQQLARWAPQRPMVVRTEVREHTHIDPGSKQGSDRQASPLLGIPDRKIPGSRVGAPKVPLQTSRRNTRGKTGADQDGKTGARSDRAPGPANQSEQQAQPTSSCAGAASHITRLFPYRLTSPSSHWTDTFSR